MTAAQPAATPTIAYQHERVTVWAGDCLDVLAELPDASVHAVVTDPPYGLEFMGKSWDSFRGEAWRSGAGITAPGYGDAERLPRPAYGGTDTANPTCATCGGRKRGAKRCDCPEPDWRVKGRALEGRRSDPTQMRAFQVWCEAWAAECLRVLVPGGHLLAFGGTRTAHRLACGIEDAGFEIRDGLVWAYGQGFPKNLDVSKAIDKLAGAEGSWRQEDHPGRGGTRTTPGAIFGQGDHRNEDNPDGLRHVYVASSDAAKAWDGWGTALKPSYEPIVMARKPVVSTIAANVLAHGTGAINVDGCRTAFASDADQRESEGKNAHARFGTEPGGNNVYGDYSQTERVDYDGSKGRWPTNMILSHSPSCSKVGTRKVRTGTAVQRNLPEERDRLSDVPFKAPTARAEDVTYADDGGQETVEAWECTPDCPVAVMDRQSGVTTAGAAGAKGASGFVDGYDGAWGVPYGDTGGASRFFTQADPETGPGLYYVGKARADERPRVGETVHPTVKPVSLMRHLVRLVTPPSGTVLDLFAGSGTTGEAALLEGMRAVLVERTPEYLPLIAQRLDRHLDPEAWLRSTGQAEGTLFG